MYVYDKTQNPPVFYQLDGWHEVTHPDWWSRNFSLEAELFDSPVNSTIKTEVPLGTLPGRLYKLYFLCIAFIKCIAIQVYST